jgi:hypothetical protein
MNWESPGFKVEFGMKNHRNRLNQHQTRPPIWELFQAESTRSMMSFFLALLMLIPVSIPARGKWGWQGHDYINNYAVDYLPPEMSFFLYQRNFLRGHASVPDGDGSPGYYHYIDIDYYQEFLNGTLPHEWDEMLELYPDSTIRKVGIVPWVVQWWTDSLSVLMSRNQWDDAWRLAANLGHYVADSHQPLHLTLNYNGQYSGNTGIHSRYESQLIAPHLGLLPLPEGEAFYWDSVIDSVFGYIAESYADVTWVLLADNLASSQDPDYGPTYYSIMWTQLESITTHAIHRAILDLASIWYTAWVNAERPIPALGSEGFLDEDLPPTQYALYPNYPNPFNPTTTIRYASPVPSQVVLRIFDVMGQEVKTITSGSQPAGVHTIIWDGRDHHRMPVSAGVYFCRLEAGAFSQTIKMINLK